MTIGGIDTSYGNYSPGINTNSYTNGNSGESGYGAVGVSVSGQESEERVIIRNPGESTEKQAGRKSSPAECETCRNRKYQDGSDENVSFKSPAHIDPDTAAARVRSHEQEHVSNAFKKAAENNGKVVACNVAIHTAVCPECGRTYVSGGTTSTQIRYFNEDNPYQKELKSADRTKYSGMNLDYAV